MLTWIRIEQGQLLISEVRDKPVRETLAALLDQVVGYSGESRTPVDYLFVAVVLRDSIEKICAHLSGRLRHSLWDEEYLSCPIEGQRDNEWGVRHFESLWFARTLPDTSLRPLIEVLQLELVIRQFNAKRWDGAAWQIQDPVRPQVRLDLYFLVTALASVLSDADLCRKLIALDSHFGAADSRSFADN